MGSAFFLCLCWPTGRRGPWPHGRGDHAKARMYSMWACSARVCVSKHFCSLAVPTKVVRGGSQRLCRAQHRSAGLRQLILAFAGLEGITGTFFPQSLGFACKGLEPVALGERHVAKVVLASPVLYSLVASRPCGCLRRAIQRDRRRSCAISRNGFFGDPHWRCDCSTIGLAPSDV